MPTNEIALSKTQGSISLEKEQVKLIKEKHKQWITQNGMELSTTLG